MANDQKPQLSRIRERMDKTVAALKEEFGSLRTGRASAGLLDPVMVDAYGSMAPLNTVAAISVPEPRSITVSVWDRSMVVAVDKAIRNAGLGLNPVVEGQNLRVPVPPLTEERRKDLCKLAAKYAEQQKVAVRNVRRDANDELKRMTDDVQKLTDEAVKRIDELLKTKEHEIMQV